MPECSSSSNNNNNNNKAKAKANRGSQEVVALIGLPLLLFPEEEGQPLPGHRKWQEEGVGLREGVGTVRRLAVVVQDSQSRRPDSGTSGRAGPGQHTYL